MPKFSSEVLNPNFDTLQLTPHVLVWFEDQPDYIRLIEAYSRLLPQNVSLIILENLEQALAFIKSGLASRVGVMVTDGNLSLHSTSGNDGAQIVKYFRNKNMEAAIFSFSATNQDIPGVLKENRYTKFQSRELIVRIKQIFCNEV